MLSWEKEISPTWGKTVTSCLNGGYKVELGELPDELLPALSKFLIISKDLSLFLFYNVVLPYYHTRIFHNVGAETDENEHSYQEESTNW